jgi:replicative DNA helicase
MKRVVEWGITEEDFLSSEPKTIFKILLATYLHPETMGSVIGPQLASEKFTQLNLADVDTSVTMEHLCLEVRNRRLSKEIKEGATRAIEEADINPVAALSHLQMAAATVMRLDAGKMTDVEMSTGLAQVLDDYFRTQRGDLVGKFLWPWEPLQAETGGGQEDDYIVFYGRPKSMKSWVLCYLISFLVDSGKRVLVYTKEMTTKNIYRRIAAFLAGIPYDDLRHARLPPHHEQVLLYWANQAKQRHSLLATQQGGKILTRCSVHRWHVSDESRKPQADEDERKSRKHFASSARHDSADEDSGNRHPSGEPKSRTTREGRV